MKLLLCALATLFSTVSLAAKPPADDCNFVLTGRARENRATVKKVGRTIAFAEINVLGEPSEILMRLTDVQGITEKTWTDAGIRRDSIVLVTWIPWQLSSKTVEFARKGSAPAKIIHIDPNGMMFLEPNLPGEQHLLLHALPDRIYEYNERSFASLGIKIGASVWVKWEPETEVVESVVP